MRKLMFALFLLATLTSSEAQRSRFSLRTSTLNLTNCLATPGNIATPIAPTETNIEIVNWTSAPTDKPHNGEFLLAFKKPTTVGTIIVYEAGKVSYKSEGTWKPLELKREANRKLQFLVPPAGDLVTDIKLTIPAEKKEIANKPPVYQATLPFLTMIPVRTINISTESTVTVSTNSPADPKRPSRNKPTALIDGVIHADANFSTPPRLFPLTKDNPEWVQFTFKEAQSIRGIFLFRGSAEHGFGESVPEFYTGNGDPSAATKPEDWTPIRGMASSPGLFRKQEILVSAKSVDTRAVRIRAIGRAHNIALGEIAVLSDLGFAPVPE